MPRIVGITTQKDSKGNLTHVTINMKKHGEKIMPVLEELGFLEKSLFDIDFENGTTLDEFTQSGYDFVKSLPWPK